MYSLMNFKRVGRVRLLAVLCCGLTLAFMLVECSSLPVQAFPFIHKRQRPQQGIPPSAQSRPGMLQAPAVPPVVKTPPVTPDPTQILVQRGVFPPEALTRTTPITRAEWAGILVRAIGHNTKLYSEFPFYRDVPVNDPDYVVIEVAREKKLATYDEDHGYYHPHQPVTYTEAYESIAHAITGPPPAPDAVTHLLRGFADRDQLPPEAAPAVAKMVRVQFFRTPKPQTLLHPKEDLTFLGATPLITDLIHLIQLRAPLQAEQETALAAIPAGLDLTLSPATSILEANLNVGQNVSFTLVNPVGPLPKESRFEGQIVAATPAARSYTVELTKVKTPEGAEYKTEAQFTIGFSPRSRITFLVPGELFSAVTRAPAEETTPPPATGQPVQTVPAPGTNPKVIVPFAPQPAPTTPQRPLLNEPGQTKPQPLAPPPAQFRSTKSRSAK